MEQAHKRHHIDRPKEQEQRMAARWHRREKEETKPTTANERLLAQVC